MVRSGHMRYGRRKAPNLPFMQAAGRPPDARLPARVIGPLRFHDRIGRAAVSRVDRMAIKVSTPSVANISDTGQVAPPLHATVAAATIGVRPPPMAAPSWNPSEIPL